MKVYLITEINKDAT